MKKITPEIITYGIHETALGEIILAQSAQGLCWLGFMTTKAQGAYKGDGLSRMKAYFTNVDFIRDEAATQNILNDVMRAWERDRLKSITLDLRGTEFQRHVWAALLNIPKGKVISYGDVANDIGKPKAARAVGSAVGENPVSLIVPCHRVVQSTGGLGNYGWGVDLKREILKREGVV